MADEVAAFAGAVDAGLVLRGGGEVEAGVWLIGWDIWESGGEPISVPPSP